MIQAWLTSVVGIVAAGVLLDIILPEGDTAKYAKGVYALIVVLVLASPVTELVKSLKEVRSSETLAADGSFLDALEYRREQADEALVEKALAEIGLDGCKVNIFAAADGGYTSASMSTYRDAKISDERTNKERSRPSNSNSAARR